MLHIVTSLPQARWGGPITPWPITLAGTICKSTSQMNNLLEYATSTLLFRRDMHLWIYAYLWPVTRSLTGSAQGVLQQTVWQVCRSLMRASHTTQPREAQTVTSPQLQVCDDLCLLLVLPFSAYFWYHWHPCSWRECRSVPGRFRHAVHAD